MKKVINLVVICLMGLGSTFAFTTGLGAQVSHDLVIERASGGSGDDYSIYHLLYPVPDDDDTTSTRQGSNMAWNYSRDGDDGSPFSNSVDFSVLYMRVKKNLLFDIKMDQYGVIIEYDTYPEFSGIKIHLEGDPSSGQVTSIYFSDSMEFELILDRFASTSEFQSFYSLLQERLGNYKSLFLWDKFLINNDAFWNSYYSDLDPCLQSKVDIVRLLKFHTNVTSRAEVLQMFDAIYQAQLAFNATCP